MNKPILVIMAAGLGSRYGGSKQTDSIGKNGESIIDYSVFDAIEAGFKRAIVIIKRDFEDTFKMLVGDRISKYIDLKYAYQELESLPEGFLVPDGRKKPWGTCHAILSAKNLIDAPIAVINADDFYGKEAFKIMYDFLTNCENSNKNEYAMIGYLLKNTLSKNGFVSRGICELDEEGYLKKVTERTKIEQTTDGARFTEDYGATWTELSLDSVVSMNMWGLTQSFVKEAEDRFSFFLENNMPSNPLKCEYFLPTLVAELINEGKVSVKTFEDRDTWYGITYKEDKAAVVDAIRLKHDLNEYPTPLWSNSLNVYEVISAYGFDKSKVDVVEYGDGHINSTFKVVVENDGTIEKYILQKINTNAFKEPEKVMFNIEAITKYLKKQILSNAGDEKRETLNLVLTSENKSFYVDSKKQYWRMFLYIEDTICLHMIEKEEHMYETGKSFGKFLKQLADFPVNDLYETIPKFHHILKWFEKFRLSIELDCCDRVKNVQSEIDFLLAKEQECIELSEMLNYGNLPERVTHNDAKLSNILLDKTTGQGICIIDLDTVMPGVSAYDFGDSIRTGASTAAEDEKDLSKVKLNLAFYSAYTKGFLEKAGDILSDEEKSSLVYGVKIMTFETAYRFFTDYLDDDVYYKIDYEDHNLVRARNQIKLIKEIDENFEEMIRIMKIT